jgi:hypothetical protein
MRTFLDYLGWNPAASFRSRAVFCGGDDDGDSSSSETGTETEATPSSVIGPSGYVSLDAIANTAVQSDPATSFSYMGQTYDNVFDYHDAIFGKDDDPKPAVTSTVKSTPVPVVSAVDPEQTTLESLAQKQSTVDDFMVDMDPFDVETVQQLADQYYDFGSEPMSVAEQVEQYDYPDILDTLDAERELASSVANLSAPDPLSPTGSTTKISSPGGVGPGQTVDFNRLIDAGGRQNYNIYSPPLSDDDMGLPDISVDSATLADDDPYSATVLPYSEPGSDDVVTSASVPDVDIPSNKNVIDAVVAGVLTGTPVEGFDIQTSKIGMPREGLLGDLNNLFGSLGGQIILDSLIPGAGLVTGFASMVDPQKRQRIADMLSGYSGQAVYNSKGELIGAVDKMTGEYVGYPSNEGGFVRGDDGNLVRSDADVPQYPDPFAGMDDDDSSGCPAGYEFDANIGQCVPIGSASSDEEPKISLGEVDRSNPPEIGIPVIPDEDPVEGMKIRTPKFFNRGGPVTPNIDRFLSSLRG